jgi:hypothetical protein
MKQNYKVANQMAFFGRKKEQTLKETPISNEVKPNLELKKEEEPRFTSPEDMVKMTTEQVNPNYAQPHPPVQNMQTVQPATQLPQVRIQPPQLNLQPIEPEKQAAAPLFVKLDRYRNILKSIGEIKSTLVLMKNALTMLNQIEKIENENMNLVASALESIEKKLATLDTEFLRPTGLGDETPQESEFENVQSVLSDLHTQIEQLKGNMQQVQ